MVGYLILHDQHAWAVGLFAYAGITDLVDGWIARKWNLQTVVGSVVDPMADKLLMTVLVGCLAVKGALPRTSSTDCLRRFHHLRVETRSRSQRATDTNKYGNQYGLQR